MKRTLFIRMAFLCFGTTAVSTDAIAQNDAKFHMELDYGYFHGFSESLHGYDYKSDSKLKGHSLTINALYNIRPDMTVGVGYGLTRFTRRYQGDNNTMPLYATFRYRPLATHRAFYAYTDLGYTLLNDRENHNFTGGFLGGIGVGYQLMFKRHFGLNFKLGYGIQQFARTPVVVSIKEKTDQATGNTFIDATYDYPSLWRHSILFGLGLVF